MRVFFLLLLLLPLSVCATEIYKWVDENGKVHFGDSPKKQDRAEKLELRVNSYEHVSVETWEGSKPSAVTANRVTMYSTSWCGYCKKARRYFQQQGIAYREYDIEKNKRAKAAYDRIGGRGVPVILVGNKRMNGFSVAGFKRIYP